MKLFAVRASLSGSELFYNESSDEQGATKKKMLIIRDQLRVV